MNSQSSISITSLFSLFSSITALQKSLCIYLATTTTLTQCFLTAKVALFLTLIGILLEKKYSRMMAKQTWNCWSLYAWWVWVKWKKPFFGKIPKEIKVSSESTHSTAFSTMIELSKVRMEILASILKIQFKLQNYA